MRYRLDTGLNEAVTNVISYGYPDGAEHLIRLRLWAHGDIVSLEVEDDGLPFDPLRAEPRPAPHTLEEAPIGGLGIQLIRAMLDECHYRREAGQNHLTMIAPPAGRTADALTPAGGRPGHRSCRTRQPSSRAPRGSSLRGILGRCEIRALRPGDTT